MARKAVRRKNVPDVTNSPVNTFVSERAQKRVKLDGLQLGEGKPSL